MYLELANNASLRSINGLEDLSRLQTLVISNNDRLKDEIAPFEGLAALQTVKVLGYHRLRVLPDLSGLVGLGELEKRADLTLGDRALGAWLTTDRRGIITGLAASALHGADFVDDTE